jgi:hypothetical protein
MSHYSDREWCLLVMDIVSFGLNCSMMIYIVYLWDKYLPVKNPLPPDLRIYTDNVKQLPRISPAQEEN